MTMRILPFPVTIVAFALAACSSSSDAGTSPSASTGDDVAVQSRPPEAAVPAIKPVDIPTRGGDGAPIELAALVEADIADARMDGAPGCSFAGEATAQPLLIAKGNPAPESPARGIVKNGDTIETIAATGGYDAILNGGAFFAKGLELRVALTGAAQDGGEGLPRPGTLTADRADGARRVYAGLWTCRS